MARGLSPEAWALLAVVAAVVVVSAAAEVALWLRSRRRERGLLGAVMAEHRVTDGRGERRWGP